uniref:Uncharacterized protein n=1 Tax=Glossina palpalis gambiensis TaxID=67801 RepID=A0A1B0BUV3_9MUSC
MGNQVHFFDFAPVRCVNLVAGITAVIGIIGSVFLLTRTTQSLVGATQAFNYKIITFYHLSLAVPWVI